MISGHAAGCAHEPHFGWDWWQHRTWLLKVQSDGARLYEQQDVLVCPPHGLAQIALSLLDVLLHRGIK